jgi:hypothetical protein
MDKPRITPGPCTQEGELTTFYASEPSAARSLVLSNMAWLLAGRGPGGAPVLMVDWDLAAPGLHGLFGGAGERPGLLELFEACRAQMDVSLRAGAHDADALACAVLAAVDWPAYIEQVDPVRPLYLLRAGRFDASYGERAARLDWDALFHACPALFRQFRLQLAQAFRHVFIDAPGGRSAAVSVCTTLLPDKIVGLFTPDAHSLDGLCGMLARAVDYRCSHEDEQRPLLLYPLPSAPAGLDSEQRDAWRRGDAAPGYQGVLEALMQSSYGRPELSLESWFDFIQLQHPAPDDVMDRIAAERMLLTLLEWFGDNYFPWQSHAELALLRAIGTALASFQGAVPPAPAPAAVVQFPALRPLARPGTRTAGTAPAALPQRSSVTAGRDDERCRDAVMVAPGTGPR